MTFILHYKTVSKIKALHKVQYGYVLSDLETRDYV